MFLTFSLDGFALLKPIGRGGQGEVWAGRHIASGAKVAIKVLTDKGMNQPRILESFRTEVRAVAALSHPHIVVVLDYGEVSEADAVASAGGLYAGTPYLVMEYAADGCLSPHRGKLEWVQVREIAVGLLEGLAHAHARGVIHRDIKGGNVLLGGERPGVKLTDFGLAHLGKEKHKDEHRSGTPSYMAPEQFDGRWRDFGPWTDLYALGCLLWSLVCGSAPYRGRSWMQLHNAHKTWPIPPLEPAIAVPRGLEGWLRDLIAKDPAHRHRRAADAAWAFHQLGLPAGGGQAVPRLAAEEPTVRPLTLIWDDPTTEVEIPIFVPGGRVDIAPPLPETWRRREPVPAPRSLLGAGLGLYGMRHIPLVGRTHTRDVLWRLLTEAVQGGIRGAILRGPAGVGKTRLARWLCERAHEVGAATILTVEHERVPSAQTGLGSMVKRHLHAVGLDRARTVVRSRRWHRNGDENQVLAVAELAHPAPEDDDGPKVRFSGPRERHAALAGFVERVCANRPAILFIDDAQWGSDALAFTSLLLEQSPDLRLLIVLTAREDLLEDDLPSGEQLEALASFRTCDIGPLDPGDRPILVRHLLGLSGALANEVERRTSGNPMFAVQLVGDWVARELLVAGDTGFQLRDGASMDLPADIRAVWDLQIARVLADRPECDGRAIEVAAVLGMAIDPDEWQAVCAELQVPISGDLVDALVRRRLISASDPGGRRRFDHGLLRESLEHRAEEAGRLTPIHAACAVVLPTLDTPGNLARSGRHALAAGEIDMAIDHLQGAAMEAGVRGEYVEAGELVSTAIGLVADRHERRTAQLLTYQARVFAIVGKLAESKALAARALELADRNDWIQERVSALLRLGVIHNILREPDPALALCRRALRNVNADTSIRDQIDLYGSKAIAHLQKGEVEEAEGCVRDASELSVSTESRQGLSTCLTVIAHSLLRRGNLDGAEEAFGEALALCRARGRRLGQAINLSGLADISVARDDHDAALIQYRAALEETVAIGSAAQHLLRTNIGSVQSLMGNYEAGRAELEIAWEAATAAGNRTLAAQIDGMLLPALAHAREWDAFDAGFERMRIQQEERFATEARLGQCLQLAAEIAGAAGFAARAERARQAAARHVTTPVRGADKA